MCVITLNRTTAYSYPWHVAPFLFPQKTRHETDVPAGRMVTVSVTVAAQVLLTPEELVAFSRTLSLMHSSTGNASGNGGKAVGSAKKGGGAFSSFSLSAPPTTASDSSEGSGDGAAAASAAYDYYAPTPPFLNNLRLFAAKTCDAVGAEQQRAHLSFEGYVTKIEAVDAPTRPPPRVTARVNPSNSSSSTSPLSVPNKSSSSAAKEEGEFSELPMNITVLRVTFAVPTKGLAAGHYRLCLLEEDQFPSALSSHTAAATDAVTDEAFVDDASDLTAAAANHSYCNALSHANNGSNTCNNPHLGCGGNTTDGLYSPAACLAKRERLLRQLLRHYASQLSPASPRGNDGDDGGPSSSTGSSSESENSNIGGGGGSNGLHMSPPTALDATFARQAMLPSGAHMSDLPHTASAADDYQHDENVIAAARAAVASAGALRMPSSPLFFAGMLVETTIALAREGVAKAETPTSASFAFSNDDVARLTARAIAIAEHSFADFSRRIDGIFMSANASIPPLPVGVSGPTSSQLKPPTSVPCATSPNVSSTSSSTACALTCCGPTFNAFGTVSTATNFSSKNNKTAAANTTTPTNTVPLGSRLLPQTQRLLLGRGWHEVGRLRVRAVPRTQSLSQTISATASRCSMNFNVRTTAVADAHYRAASQVIEVELSGSGGANAFSQWVDKFAGAADFA